MLERRATSLNPQGVSGWLLNAPTGSAALRILLPPEFPRESRRCPETQQTEPSHHAPEREQETRSPRAPSQTPRIHTPKPALSTCRDALAQEHSDAESRRRNHRSGERHRVRWRHRRLRHPEQQHDQPGRERDRPSDDRPSHPDEHCGHSGHSTSPTSHVPLPEPATPPWPPTPAQRQSSPTATGPGRWQRIQRPQCHSAIARAKAGGCWVQRLVRRLWTPARIPCRSLLPRSPCATPSSRNWPQRRGEDPRRAGTKGGVRAKAEPKRPGHRCRSV